MQVRCPLRVRDVDSTPEQRKSFGEAVDRALMAGGKTRAWLGAQVADLCAKPSPLTQSAISQWIAGDIDPARSYVFAAEKALELKPGTLSRLLGYLPAEARAAVSVSDAIDADPHLTPKERAALKALHRTLTS